jgi:hypothetical protein
MVFMPVAALAGAEENISFLLPVSLKDLVGLLLLASQAGVKSRDMN